MNKELLTVVADRQKEIVAIAMGLGIGVGAHNVYSNWYTKRDFFKDLEVLDSMYVEKGAKPSLLFEREGLKEALEQDVTLDRMTFVADWAIEVYTLTSIAMDTEKEDGGFTKGELIILLSLSHCVVEYAIKKYSGAKKIRKGAGLSKMFKAKEKEDE